MASLSNSVWQNRKERANQSFNNVNMVVKAKRGVVNEEVSLLSLGRFSKLEKELKM